MKITSADFVPELVFQPVKITSADSAGQCYKSFIRSHIKNISMKSFIGPQNPQKLFSPAGKRVPGQNPQKFFSPAENDFGDRVRRSYFHRLE